MSDALRWTLVALLMTGGLSAGAQFMEHVMGLDPCPLCLMQRIWVMIAGVAVCIALADDVRRSIHPFILALCAVIGAGFSTRQLYLQSLPADQVPACGPDLAYMIDAFPFADVVRAMTLGTGNCAEVQKVLGLSIPLWALLGFAALLGIAVLWWRSGRNPA